MEEPGCHLPDSTLLSPCSAWDVLPATLCPALMLLEVRWSETWACGRLPFPPEACTPKAFLGEEDGLDFTAEAAGQPEVTPGHLSGSSHRGAVFPSFANGARKPETFHH